VEQINAISSDCQRGMNAKKVAQRALVSIACREAPCEMQDEVFRALQSAGTLAAHSRGRPHSR
jgi:hypothetical protein